VPLPTSSAKKKETRSDVSRAGERGEKGQINSFEAGPRLPTKEFGLRRIISIKKGKRTDRGQESLGSARGGGREGACWGREKKIFRKTILTRWGAGVR